jgi:hypothetical protein
MSRKTKNTVSFLFALVLCLGVFGQSSGTAQAAPVTITNGTQFTDMSGNVAHAHGGGVIKVSSFYYWFGENRSTKYVDVYRSTDLKSWEFRNHVLTPSSAAELNSANIERPKVIFNSTTNQYVMWMHKENASDYSEARVGVATSSTVDGVYTYRGSFRPLNNDSRDMTVFRDDNGTAYLISATRVNADLNIYQLTSDYLGVSSLVKTLWAGSFREAPAMFKRNGVYFLLTSGATGWAPNQQKYATATSVSGTWSALQNIGDTIGFASQTAYVLPIQGSQTTSYLYMGDRWAGAWGGPVNDSQYVWLPLQFSSNTSMSMSWADTLTIDTATGTVQGSASSTFYRLIARHSSKCAGVNGSSTADGATVVQQTCGSGTNQQWRFQSLGGGYYRVVNRNSSRCLDISSGSTADGTTALQWTCNGGNNQQWQLQDVGSGYYRLIVRHSGKCLDVNSSSTADGAKINQWTCNSGTNQQWQRPQV